ncbi:hypothetical protein Tco_0407104 [Tanacetum coccineum]
MQTQMNNLATSNQRLENMLGNFIKMNTASSSGTGSLPSNTIANPKGELKAITTRSGLYLDGPTVPMPPPFINPEEDERVEETLTDPEHVAIPLLLSLSYRLKLHQKLSSIERRIPLRFGIENQSSSSSPTLISLEESELIWKHLKLSRSDSFPLGNSNPLSLFPPFHNSLSGSTTSSSPSLPISGTSDYSLEEFADELANHISPGK